MPYIPLAPLLTTLGVLLSLALMVERMMTIASWLIDRLSLVKASTEWDGAKQKTEELSQAVRAKQEQDLLGAAAVSGARQDPREIPPNPDSEIARPESRFDVVDIVPPSAVKVTKEFWIQLFGGLVAVAGCYYMKFSIWPLVLSAQGVQPQASPEFWEFVLSGVIIGAGSKPVNFLMNFLINRKITVTKEDVKASAPEPQAAAAPPPPPVIVAHPADQTLAIKSIEEIAGFTYDGGDRPRRLEHTHLRTQPINLIVYHHTAMHSESPFEELIKEFDRKGWLTGYHSVIMKDGTIRTLCRWDRFGNHVQGYNARSLGVALHGNFETNPKVPFANINGKLGITHPTSAQLDAAARIVALWTRMYGVPVNFTESILPHYKLAVKACPGSNFPHTTFHQRVKDYAELWSKDTAFDKALKRFMTQPMLIA